MEGTHLHLLFNHLPIVGTMFGAGILAYGVVRREQAVGNVGLAVLALSALFAVAAFFTGEEAEHTVMDMGIDHDLVEPHELAGEIAIWTVVVGGLLALGALYLYAKKHDLAKTFTQMALLAAVVNVGMFVWVGNTGGQIRRPELRGQIVEDGHEHDHEQESEADDD